MTAAHRFPPSPEQVGKWADHFGLNKEPSPPRSHPELPGRNFAADREAIPTACGRIVERTKQAGRSFLYRLWEPVLAGSQYGTTRRDRSGKVWGLARTRKPAVPAEYDAAIAHEMKEARRAMDLMRATVRELALRDANGRPGGIAQCIYEERGDILLFSDPEVCARLVESQRGGR